MTLSLFDPSPTDRTGAILSPCGTYRYRLWRRWDAGPDACFVMLNPSTATAETDDATIRRCCGFARAWGCGGLQVVNLFALRATDPRELRRHPDPVGPENDRHLREVVRAGGGRVVCAWGRLPKPLQERVTQLRRLLADVEPVYYALKILADGSPGHPLYLPGDLQPVRYLE